MKREQKLIVNTAILSIGKVLPKLTTFITLPIMTACLTKAEYGTYDLIATLILLVMPVATLQIQSAAFRFLIESRENRGVSASIISNIFAVTVPISVVGSVVVALVLSVSPMERLCVGLYFFLDTLFGTLGQIVRGLGNNKHFAFASIINSVVVAIGIVVGVYFLHLGLLGCLIALAVSKLVGTVYFSLHIDLFSYLDRKSLSFAQIRTMIAYSWPLIPNNLSAWVLKLSDRLVITAFLGLECTAVYAVANKIPNMLAIAQSVMVMAWQENATLASRDADADAYYSKMFRAAASFLFACTAVLIAATPLLFRLLIKGDYAEAYYHMPILILAMYFFAMSSYFGGIYVAQKKTVASAVTTIIAAAVNLAIDLAFVRLIGVWAGSVSTLVAYMILFYLRMHGCKKIQKMTIDLKMQLAVQLIMLVMIGLCYFRHPLAYALNAVIAIVFSYLFNKALIRTALQSILSRIRRTDGAA